MSMFRFILILIVPFVAPEAVLGGGKETRTVCAPQVNRLPLQKLELTLTWTSNRSKFGSKLDEISARFGNLGFAGRDSSLPFNLYAEPVKKGILCELLYRHGHEYVIKALSPVVCEECTSGCTPTCAPRILKKGKPTNNTTIDRFDSVLENITGETGHECAERDHTGKCIAASLSVAATVRDGIFGGHDGLKERCEVNSPSRCVVVSASTLPNDLEVKWEVTVDHQRVALLIMGIVMVVWYRGIGSSPITHTLLGGVLGIAIFVLIVMWYMWKQTKNAVPFGQSTFALMNILLVVAPSVGLYFFHTVAPSWSWVIEIVKTIAQIREPYYEFPVGAAILVLAFVGGIWLGQKIFGSEAFEEIKGDVPFHIASNGARIDEIPDPDAANFPRRVLQWMVFSAGVIALMRSTTVPAMNLTILGILLVFDTLVYLKDLYFMSREVAASSRKTMKMTKEEYQEQMKQNTARELEKLRNYLSTQQGGRHISNVKDQHSELRMRRFVDGGGHIDRHLQDEEEEGGRGWFKWLWGRR